VTNRQKTTCHVATEKPKLTISLWKSTTANDWTLDVNSRVYGHISFENAEAIVEASLVNLACGAEEGQLAS
jgi:hypothetical protein